MLSREGAPGTETHRHDLVTRLMDLLVDHWIAGVECDERVQVPVAGVEDVEHRQVVAVGDVVDTLHRLDEAGAGHDGIVQVVVRGHLGDGAEGRLARFP